MPKNSVIIGNPWRVACTRDDFINKYVGCIDSVSLDYKSREGLCEIANQMGSVGWIN